MFCELSLNIEICPNACTPKWGHSMGDEEVILSKTESLRTLNLQHLRCLFGVRFLFEKGGYNHESKRN